MTMPKFALSVFVCLVLVGVFAVSRQPVAAQDTQIFAGCDIPKSYGRLVAIMNPPNSSLAGQAVFEDGEGTVRWIALMFSAELPQLPKAQRKSAPMFPQLPRYECALGDVWTRH